MSLVGGFLMVAVIETVQRRQRDWMGHQHCLAFLCGLMC